MGIGQCVVDHNPDIVDDTTADIFPVKCLIR